MSKEDNWTVGMVHHICYICGSECEHQIILPEKLTKETKEQIEEANHKAIGYSEKPCEECSKHLENEYIALIGIDPEKSQANQETSTVTFENVYRTGLVWLKQEACKGYLGLEPEDREFIFVETAVIDDLKEQYERLGSKDETETL